MTTDTSRYKEMFDYLRDPVLPTEEHGNFVFGRADLRLVQKMGELYTTGLAQYFLVTGGIGKDSGHLTELGIAEADYLSDEAIRSGIPPALIYRETKAANGGENARFGLRMIHDLALPADELSVIAHATSLRRLAATLDIEARNINQPAKLYRIPTEYPFDPTNPIDRDEARAELLRLADWPQKGWATAQPDLPSHLVDFARDKNAIK